MKKKAYIVCDFSDENCAVGRILDDSGNTLGGHYSSTLDFLRMDLSRKVNPEEYDIVDLIGKPGEFEGYMVDVLKEWVEYLKKTSSPSSWFEVVDHTEEDIYYTLGNFPTLEDALKQLDGISDPNDLVGDHFDYEDYCCFRVYERKIGWQGMGAVVHERTWRQEFDDGEDAFKWIMHIEEVKNHV